MASMKPFFRVWNGDNGRFLDDFDSKVEAMDYAKGDPDHADYYEVGFCTPIGEDLVETVEITEVHV